MRETTTTVDPKSTYLATLRARLEHDDDGSQLRRSLVSVALEAAEAAYDKGWAAGVVAGQSNALAVQERLMDAMKL